MSFHLGYQNHNLPSSIGRRISDLSCDEAQFKKHKDTYDAALSTSGFTEKITYQNAQPKRRRRSREIIWFNPPYSDSVVTNIGKKYLEIVSKCFPPEHKFRCIFNRNTLKLSYSCMPNMKSIIAGHNKRILASSQTPAADTRTCNCRVKADCPVNGECLKSAVIYKATVTSSQGRKEYVGLTEMSFKARYSSHKHDLKHEDKGTTKGTSLSKYVWSLKKAGIQHSIDWSIIRQSTPYKCGTRRCDLCLSEKLEIVTNKSKHLLNKRSEMINKCRHSRKFKLCDVT